MKRVIYIVSFLLVTLMATSCQDLLFDNKNPDMAPMVTPQQSLPVVVFYASQINYDHAEYGIYLSQTLTTGGKSQTGTYAYKSGWEFLTMNRHPQWRRHFYDIGVNVNALIQASKAANSRNTELIARSIRLMSTQLTTDMFGDMPLTEAYESNAPKYDSQESIYQWMLQEADELISLYDNSSWVDAPTNVKITSKMDRIFAGDMKKWRQFTCAIKARILLRKLPNWDNSPATCKQIIDAVDAAYNADWAEPKYIYTGGVGEANCPWGPAQPKIGGWESRDNLLDKAIVSKYFCENVMGVYPTPDTRTRGWAEDPRLAKMMNPRPGPQDPSVMDAGTKFRYLENNIGMGVSYKETNYPDLFAGHYTQNTSYVSLITTEELLLIKAEALYWAGDKTKARELTLEAANLNMDRYDITDAPGRLYRNNYFVGDPGKTMGVNLKEKYFPEGSKFTIGHLMRQKYVCMYLQSEQWTDMRRYCYSNSTNQRTFDGSVIYPGLRRPYNLYEAYWFNSTEEQWVQRINYDPETEEKYNKGELERLGAYKNSEWLKKPMIWALYNGARQ